MLNTVILNVYTIPKSVDLLNNLKFQTDRSWQTVKTQDMADQTAPQGLQCWRYCLHLLNFGCPKI